MNQMMHHLGIVHCNPSTSNPLRKTSLSDSIQISMWDKVKSYMDDPTSYTNAPGVTDYSCVLVKSQSSTRPHFVQKTSKGVYKCDKECLMYKSTNGMCSHALLAASLSGDVDNFVNHYSKSKVPVNYANLAQHGLPVGGKKPSSRRKSSSKKTTAAVKDVVASADHLKRTKRTPVSTAATTQANSIISTQPPSNPSQQMTSHSLTHSYDSTVFAPYASINTLSTGVNLSTATPPPLIHYSPGSSSVGQPFSVMFLNARISRCQGCRGQIMQGLPAPDDVVIQHKEHVLFQNPNSGNWQLSRDLRNTYYHPCISPKHPGFNNSELLISPEVRRMLNPSHLSLFHSEFGLLL